MFGGKKSLMYVVEEREYDDDEDDDDVDKESLRNFFFWISYIFCFCTFILR
jgi:hypothetical protein